MSKIVIKNSIHGFDDENFGSVKYHSLVVYDKEKHTLHYSFIRGVGSTHGFSFHTKDESLVLKCLEEIKQVYEKDPWDLPHWANIHHILKPCLLERIDTTNANR